MKRVLIAVSSLALAACAASGRRAEDRDPPEKPPPAALAAPVRADRVPAIFAGATRQSAANRLANAAALADQARRLIPGWGEADGSLALARAAIARSDWPRAAMNADEAQAITEAALSDRYARLAQAELVKIYGYTGLDDVQLAQLRYAEEALVSGNARLAYGRLRTLDSQLVGRTRAYTVASGDSLWIISARPDVYANALLWPLIWQANVTVVPNPNRLLKGQMLQLPQHPTVDEVARAVDVARGRTPRTTRIGPVREAAR